MDALVIVDMQKYFISKELREAFPSMTLPDGIVSSVAGCLKDARRLGVPVIHVKTEYEQNKSDWPESKKHRDTLYCLKGSEEADFIAGLEPEAGETVIVKTRYSAFYNTDLSDRLQNMGVDSIALAGYAVDGCVRFTAADAFNIGFRTVLLDDCLESSMEPLDKSIEYLRIMLLSSVSDAASWLAGLPE